MCDTFAFRHSQATWFAKNSDREPDEPQWVEYIAPVTADTQTTLQTTYISIAQVPQRFGYLMGRPAWMWGAEMGVNDQGVAIGNEAIFTRGAKGQDTALLGMDLVRLALERSTSAAHAVEVITGLLKSHGQGGPAGYNNKNFRYDNSYLIADQREIWQLETCGRDWVAKQQTVASISNALNLAPPYDKMGGNVDPTECFNQRNAWFMTRVAQAKKRRACTLSAAQQLAQAPGCEPNNLFAVLRSHRLHQASGNYDVCMHAKGFLRPTGTTNSMVVKLTEEGPEAWFTGTSLACVSVFKPARFDRRTADTFSPELWQAQATWLSRASAQELANRQAIIVEQQNHALV